MITDYKVGDLIYDAHIYDGRNILIKQTMRYEIAT